jgi:ATP-dependent DNA helicase RecG
MLLPQHETIEGQQTFDFEGPAKIPQQLLSVEQLFELVDEECLRKWFEDSRFEKKSALAPVEMIGDYIAMWSNTSPDGGLIVVGIANDTKFEGCIKLGPAVNQRERCPDVYCPEANWNMKKVVIHRDKDGGEDFVLVFIVRYNPTKVVRTVKGDVFVRRGESIKKLTTQEEIRQLQNDKGETSFELAASGLNYPDDFNIDAINSFAASVMARKGWVSHTVPDVLELMHLGKRTESQFEANMACAWLFARDPRLVTPGCRIRFLRFPSEEAHGEKWNAIKDEFIDGTIPQQLQRIEAILKSQFRVFSRLDKSGKFFTSPEYPEFAWYEALVNAVAHRSYGNGLKTTPIFVKMFDDRLEVESPGAFLPFVTPENIYDVHRPRNPFLMDAMYYLDYVKCAHEGTRRMRELMQNQDLPVPEFHQDTHTFTVVKVTLRNGIKQRRVWVDSDVVELLGNQIAHSLTPDEKRVINFCAEHGSISVSNAQRLTGKSWPASSKMLQGLCSQNILIHKKREDRERDPGARYELRKERIAS